VTPEAIDPLAEDFCLLSDLLKQLPHRPSPPVVTRWVQQGTRGTRLHTLKIAGRHMTTRREFKRFLQALQSAPAETPRDESVDRQLAAAGYA